MLRNALEAVAMSSVAPQSSDTPRSVILQLAASIAGNRDGTFEIQLAPEELGRVILTLQTSDDAVVVAIQAERQETLDLMRRHADILQREFREAGFTSLSFSFGQEPSDGRSQRLHPETSRFDDLVPQPTAAQTNPVGPRVGTSTRLDMRL
jgi:flagellar hook-length control protein FliK